MKMINQMVAAAALFGCMCGLAGTVTVEGKGSVMRHPDGMELKFTVAALDKDMEKSRAALAGKRTTIMAALDAAGVTDAEVSDSNIRMNPEYHNEDAEGNLLSEYAEKGKRVFDGYKHSMDCKFRAKLDTKRLEKIYLALVKTKAVEDLKIDFYVLDPKSVQDEARRLAVENARTVAAELCKAALTTLGDVKEINYNARRYGADICCSEARIKKALLGVGDAQLFPSINVEDIEVNDEVVVKWEIK